MSVTEKAVAKVDVAACEQLAALLRRQSIPPDREESQLPGFNRNETGNFYLLLVAICHQTSPRGKKPLEGFVAGRLLRGWDFLSAKLELAAQHDRSLLSPSRWTTARTADVRELFHDDRLGDRLIDPGGRSALIRDLGCVMLRHGWLWIEDMYRSAKGRVAVGDPNLASLLSEFRAYDDPVRKKSFFFLSLMRNSGLWQYADPENLGPPVDYHEVRGHLRIGTVIINDAALRTKLFESQPVTASEDVVIRQAVLDAIMLLSELTDLRNPSQLHYLFWNVFRSCCTRESPHCAACPTACPLPGRYVPLAIRADATRRCPFSSVCASAQVLHRIHEHVFETDYY